MRLKTVSSVSALLLALALAGSARAQTPAAGYDAVRLYNLGNAYARAGQPGLAVLSYERARLLTPTDADLEFNLRQVRDAAHVAAEAPSKLKFLTLPNGYWVQGLILSGLILVGASGIAWRRKLARPRRLTAGAVAGALCLGWAGCNALLVWPKLQSAVVIAAQAPVRAAPAPLGDTLFVLNEAETVNVMAEHEDFVLVTTPQGRAGWIPRSAVAPIVPRR